LITESNGTDLSLPDRPDSRGNNNQDFKDTGISPSQETVSFDTHNRVSHNKIDPDSLFNLQDEPQDKPQDQLTNNNDIELAPEVTIKRGRPKGSRNRVYSPIAEEDKRTTRSSKASTSLNTTSKQAHTAYVEDNPNETPYNPHNFSFDPSYEDSNGEQDQDYVDNRVPDDKSEYHHAFYTEAKSNPCNPTTLEEAKARSD
jgi:hypothetical protein